MMKLQQTVIYTSLTVICVLLLVPILCYTFPSLVGADSSYTVMGESMSPTLNRGDLIFNRKVDPSAITIGDVVTVRSGDFIYTHRVVEVQDGGFRLKGDANAGPDPILIAPSQIIGQVLFALPFSYLRTPLGFVVSLWVPAALIIGKQLNVLYTRKKRENETSIVDTRTLLLATIVILSVTHTLPPYFLWSNTYFSDSESAHATFQAGVWQIDATVDIKPDTLNLGSQGQWVTVYAYIDTAYDENNIDVSTVQLETVKAECGEVQDDGRLMVKFDRTAVIEYLIEEGCGDGNEAILTVSGQFTDGTQFTGWDSIRVEDNG